jgi:PKD repeat protein
LNSGRRQSPDLLNWYPLFLVVCVLLLLGISGARGDQDVPIARWYVSEAGSDSTGDGSLIDPFLTIAHAMSQALSLDTVILLPGRYEEIISIGPDEYIHIRSEDGASSAVIDGGIQLSGTDIGTRVLIQGVTIVNGEPGISVDSISPDIVSCIIDSCSSASDPGAGIRLNFSRALIRECTISNCISDQGGSGIYSTESSPRIIDCVIDNNACPSSDGAGIRFSAVTLTGFRPIIANNIIIRNDASRGGGIYAAGNELILNNLISENTSQITGTGIYIADGAQTEAFNNILAYNNDGDALACFSAASGTTGHNCFFSNTGSDLGAVCNDLGGNILSDPGFVNYADGDYHLLGSSPCINAGLDLDSLPSEDFDGDSRVYGDTVDIGPDEYFLCDLAVDFTAVPSSGCVFTSRRFNALIEGEYDSIYWNFGDGEDTTAVEQVFHTYNSTGIYTVILSVTSPCTTATVQKDDFIVVDEEPVASFSVDVDSGCAPLTVHFQDESLGDPDQWEWYFGDSQTSDSTSPTHVYTEGGIYTVSLIVRNQCNEDMLTVDSLLLVIGNVEVDFAADPLMGPAYLSVSFSDISINDPVEWTWDFGNDSTSSIRNPSTIYTQPGIYNVSLTAANDCGVPDTETKDSYITVTGFELDLVDTSGTRFTKRLDVLVDTLYGPFSPSVTLEIDTIEVPDRGGVAFDIEPAVVTEIPDTVAITATVSKDMSPGSFSFVLNAYSGTNQVTDQFPFEILSDPIQIVGISSDTIDMDSVQLGMTGLDTLLILNTSTIQDNLLLRLISISILGSTAFDAVWSAGTIFPGARPIPVSFEPTDTGEQTATLRIETDDPVSPIVDVALIGRGIPERILPFVVSSSPADSDTDVSIRTIVEIDLSEGIVYESSPGFDYVTVSSGLTGSEIPGGLEYITDIPNRWVFRFTPEGDLLPLDWITFSVSGDIEDAAGNTLDGNRNQLAEGAPVDNDSIVFRTGPAVFPGDANNDGVVNEIDVLPLGVFWMLQGPGRDGDHNVWEADPALSWDPLGATYADCNGDSVVNEVDLHVIGLHWGQTHDFANPVFNEGDYDLREYESAFEAMYLSLSGAPDNEFSGRVLSLLGRYVRETIGPGEFVLSQNFPNPFNPTTYIQYNLPSDCHVLLTIHNILGQTVMTLVDQHQSGGLQRVTWDGTSESGETLPSGIYFYRLTANGLSQVKKMMLIR